MSKIDDLVARLCPDGVEWKALGEIGTVTRGSGLQKKDFTTEGVGCIHYGQIYTYYGAFATTTKSRVSFETASNLLKINRGDLVVAVTSENVEDICKAVVWLGDEQIVTGGHSAVVRHDQNPKYIAYCFQTEDFQRQKRKKAMGVKVLEMKADKLASIRIPVPPMEVQEEIVRVLDAFADFESKLEDELQAELEARRKQYAYYRDKLLDFGDGGGASWMTLGEIGELERGKRFTISDYVDEGLCSIHYGEIYTHYGVAAKDTVSHLPEAKRPSLRFAKPGEVIIAATGENILDLCKAVAWLGDEDVAVHDDCWIFKSERANPIYISHALRTRAVYRQKIRYISSGKVSRISGSSIAKLAIWLPSLDEQQRIVDILDRLDALVSDISDGLPTEIEARRKQYAYYRDKLLAFDEKVA